MAAESDVTKTHEYFCSFPGCFKTFSKPNRLEIHQRSHTGEKPFQCVVPGCGKKYARSTHLRRHEDNSHELNGEPLQKEVSCTVDGCGMTFTLVQNLNKHIKRKHMQRQFTCEYDGCRKSFKKNQHLKVHEFEHTKIKPFLCSYEGCSMRFLVPSKLHRHEKVHTGYKCDESECTAIFSKWTLLRKHKATQHAVERRCPQCEKTFSTRQWLRQHMSVHSSEREVFACPRDNCGRSYLNQRNLLAHIRSYHDGNHIECPYPDCPRRFTTEQKLKQHQDVHNPNKPPPRKRSKKSKQKNVAALLCGVKETVSHGVDDITTPQEDKLYEVSHDKDDITNPLEDKLNEVSHDKDDITTPLEDKLNEVSHDKDDITNPLEDKLNEVSHDKDDITTPLEDKLYEVSHDKDDITTPLEDKLNEVSHDKDDITTPLEDKLNEVSHDKDDITTPLEDKLIEDSHHLYDIPPEDRLGCSQRDEACVEMREEECFVNIDSGVEKGVSDVDHIEQDCVEMLDDCVGSKTTVPCENTEAVVSVKTVSEDCSRLEHDCHSKSSNDTDSGHLTVDRPSLTLGQQCVTHVSTSVPVDNMCTCSCYDGQAIDPVPVDFGGKPNVLKSMCVSSTCLLETKNDGEEASKCRMAHTHIGHSPRLIPQNRRRGMCDQ